MGNRSWILPVKFEQDLKAIKQWLTMEDYAGLLDFHYIVRSPFNLEGSRTKSPNYYLCASSDGSSAIEALFREGYGHEPLLLGEADIDEETFELDSGWNEARYSNFISFDEADFREEHEPAQGTLGFTVDSENAYEVLLEACNVVNRTPESGKAFLVPVQIVWLKAQGSNVRTAPTVIIRGLTTPAVELLSEKVGAPLHPVSADAVFQAYPEEDRETSPAWFDDELLVRARRLRW